MKRAAGAFAVLAVLTIAMTWPMARHLSTEAAPHQDVYFNMWRLRWIAHALGAQPARLFDANIFYPEPGTLALSDAMIVEGVVAAPLHWAGLSPLTVQNVMILLPIALSGLAMFALVRELTGSRGGGAIAAIAFAFAPYRFDHLMHMELQWTVWMPLAFLALHRTIARGRWRDGLAVGACLALQMLSCIYYGVFLLTVLPIAAVVLLWREGRATWMSVARPLAAGAVVALAITALYAVPYLRQHQRVGDRSPEEVRTYSARPSSYLDVPSGNRLYGREDRPGRPERRLFPGAIVVLLGVPALLLRRPSRAAVAYVIVAVVAFDTSLGFGGFTYPVLDRLIPAYRGLRALARISIFVMMALSVLAGYGYAAIAAARGAMARRIICAALCAGLLIEYSTRLTLVDFPGRAAPVYRILAGQPRGVVAEFPVPLPELLPGPDPVYAYMSTFHWFPLVNGYSGNYPPSYLARLERLRLFPDAASLRQLRGDGVKYVILHNDAYSGLDLNGMRTALASIGMAELGTFPDVHGQATLFAAR